MEIIEKELVKMIIDGSAGKKLTDEGTERYTLENRLDDLNHIASNVLSLSHHIDGILFGMGVCNGCELVEDKTPSIVSTLDDIETQVQDAWKVLDKVASALSNSKRLTVNR